MQKLSVNKIGGEDLNAGRIAKRDRGEVLWGAKGGREKEPEKKNQLRKDPVERQKKSDIVV